MMKEREEKGIFLDSVLTPNNIYMNALHVATATNQSIDPSPQKRK